MKRVALLVAVLLVIGSLAGCGNAAREAESAFKAGFSLGAIVKANKGSLMAGSRISSGTEAGPPEPFVQRHEGMIVQVDPAHASAFMDGVRTTVEETLIRSGARILGRGGDARQVADGKPVDPTYFWFGYSEDAVYGVMHIWAVPGEGTSLTLIALITES
jgi:hypothetical protein